MAVLITRKCQYDTLALAVIFYQKYGEKAWACDLNGITQRGRFGGWIQNREPVARLILYSYTNPLAVWCHLDHRPNAFSLLYHILNVNLSNNIPFNVTLIFHCLLVALCDDGCSSVLNRVNASSQTGAAMNSSSSRAGRLGRTQNSTSVAETEKGGQNSTMTPQRKKRGGSIFHISMKSLQKRGKKSTILKNTGVKILQVWKWGSKFYMLKNRGQNSTMLEKRGSIFYIRPQK